MNDKAEEEEKEFSVSVLWTTWGVVRIKAKTVENAMEIVEKDGSISLPEGDFLEGSFTIDRDITAYLNRESEKQQKKD